jgi:hypothetical protein
MQPRYWTNKKMAYLFSRSDILWGLSSKYTGELIYIMYRAIVLTIRKGLEFNTISRRRRKKDCSCGLRPCLISYHLKSSTKHSRIVEMKLIMQTSVRHFSLLSYCWTTVASEIASIWQLIGLSEYIVHFTENLMRECILWCSTISKERQSCKCIYLSS